MLSRLISLAAFAFVLVACPAPPPPPPPPPPAPPAPPAPPPPPPPAPVIAEPAGIGAGAHKAPDAPKGKGMWAVDSATTEVSFLIVSNSSGPITGHFKDTAGSFDAKTKKGVFTVDLTKMSTTNKDNAGNPVRDANVIESFFGARAFASTPANAANAPKKGDVETAWKALAGKLANGVSKAALVVDTVEGAAADPKEGAAADGVVNGKLVLWDSVEVPVSFPVTVTKKGDTLSIKGNAPATFDIEKATGTAIQKALFANMLAAGCAHQPGIQTSVAVNLNAITLKKTK